MAACADSKSNNILRPAAKMCVKMILIEKRPKIG